jgi:hypothetical protein
VSDKKAKIVICATLAVLFVTLSQVHAQRPSKPDVSSHLVLMGLKLGRNTLVDVQRKLGKSPVGHCSQEEGASNEICYASSGPDKTKVFFESGFSGGWSHLDAFKVVSGSHDPGCSLQCQASSGITSDVHTDGGLKLGLTQAELIALLGSPLRADGNNITFQWESRKPMTKAEIQKSEQHPVQYPYWNIVDTIEVIVADSKVIQFEVSHSVTN